MLSGAEIAASFPLRRAVADVSVDMKSSPTNQISWLTPGEYWIKKSLCSNFSKYDHTSPLPNPPGTNSPRGVVAPRRVLQLLREGGVTYPTIYQAIFLLK